MKRLTIREMRAALGRLDDILEEEGELVVTRHGKSVARVLPVQGRRETPSHKALRQSMSPVSVSSEVLLRREREER